jgi:hypothetical protein
VRPCPDDKPHVGASYPGLVSGSENTAPHAGKGLRSRVGEDDREVVGIGERRSDFELLWRRSPHRRRAPAAGGGWQAAAHSVLPGRLLAQPHRGPDARS